MNKPISIIVPCYNHGRLLLEAIASLEKCDAELFEVIIVNDGSTEKETIEILNELKNRFAVIDQENAGLGAARNKGIEAARGEYILPLDSDNIIYPNYLTSGLRVLKENPSVGAVYGRRDFFGDLDKKTNYRQPKKFDLASLLVENYIDACAIIRKVALEECNNFATDLPEQGFEDWDLWLSMAERHWEFYFLDEIAYAYRIRKDSMTSLMMQEASLQKNMEYLSRKHAMLLRQVVIEQYYELRRRRSWVPYSIRQIAKKVYFAARSS